jgi:nucleotidyltransferase/DNA polymerase involved in DNA repair
MRILDSFSPTLEQVSVDEAFLDITGTYKLFGTPRDTCLKVKERIKRETGLTASIGLAPNKMTAKIASGLKKPDGLVEVVKEDLMIFLEPLDVGLIWGVGAKTKEVLSKMGINTIGDLASRSKDSLIGLFGKNGIWFWEVSHGIDESEVVAEREAKSVSNEFTFEEDTADQRLVEKELAALSELVADRLREDKIKARTITLKIRLEGFQTYTRSTTLPEPTNFTEDLIKTIQKLYRDFETKERKVRLVGVRASNLSSAGESDLFQVKPSAKIESLHKAIDKIKARFGKGSISRASSK